MLRKFVIGIIASTLALSTSMAFGLSTLTTSAFRHNGAVINPGGINASTGLGAINLEYGAGTYDILAFFDHEIDLFETGFDNENATATGVVAAGQTWEANIPQFPSVANDIYDNFLHNALNNDTNGLESTADDVAIAMGMHFTVNDGWRAYLSFNVTDSLENIPPEFYLTQTDDLSGNSIYFYSTLDYRPSGGPTVPEPSTFLLFGLALGGAVIFRKRMKK